MHSRLKCKHLVPDVCSYGHPPQRQCHAEVKCGKFVQWKCPEGHTLSGSCHGGRSKACKVCKLLEEREAKAQASERARQQAVEQQELKLAELQAELRAAEQLEANEGTLELIRKEQELLMAELAAKNRQNQKGSPPPPPPRPLSSSTGEESGAQSSTSSADDVAGRDPASGNENQATKVYVLQGSDSSGSVPAGGLDQAVGLGPKASADGPDGAKAAGASAPAMQSRPPDVSEPKPTPSVASSNARGQEPNNAQQVEKTDDSDDLAEVLQAYTSKGLVAADNVLDSIVGSRRSGSQAAAGRGYIIPPGLAAMRCIIANELDPNGRTAWEHHGHCGAGNGGGPSRTPIASLSEAVCRSGASFLELHPKYPMQGKEHARALVQFSDKLGNSGGSCLPKQWIENAREAQKSVAPVAPKSSSAAAAGASEDASLPGV